jgi:hypothetical protein
LDFSCRSWEAMAQSRQIGARATPNQALYAISRLMVMPRCGLGSVDRAWAGATLRRSSSWLGWMGIRRDCWAPIACFTSELHVVRRLGKFSARVPRPPTGMAVTGLCWGISTMGAVRERAWDRGRHGQVRARDANPCVSVMVMATVMVMVVVVVMARSRHPGRVRSPT